MQTFFPLLPLMQMGTLQYGTNSYAVLHAPKTDGAEALVLSASWLSREEGRVNTRGIALLLGLGKYLSSTYCFQWSGSFTTALIEIATQSMPCGQRTSSSSSQMDTLREQMHGSLPIMENKVRFPSSTPLIQLSYNPRNIVEGVASLNLTTGAIWAALNVDYPHHSFKNIGFYFSERSSPHRPASWC